MSIIYLQFSKHVSHGHPVQPLALCCPGFKSGESNTETADQICTHFLHINICVHILYKLLHLFIHLSIVAPIHSNTNSRGTNYSRKTTNDCDPLIPLYLITCHNSKLVNLRSSTVINHKLGYCFSLHRPPTDHTGIDMVQITDRVTDL